MTNIVPLQTGPTTLGFLLSLLELIVLTLTAMIISLQLANSFYDRIEHAEREDIESYMPIEMSFVGLFLIGVATVVILLYMGYLALVKLSIGHWAVTGIILLLLSFGIILFALAITGIASDMTETIFSRPDE